jgi:peptidoglycan/LPS O-acetylase OafA/YrhL
MKPLSAFPDSKPRYEILDGLRGVAAVMVVLFHIFEAHAANSLTQIINHGYLAVDFFYVLSGFVIGYAYDDRWGKMNLWSFFKRRLIRLHPMVIMGTVIGAVCFYFSGYHLFPLVNGTPVWKMLIVMLVGFTMIPLLPSMDIRGWQEMYPLNGPAWTLFLEYIGNILYALIIRKFSKKVLSVFVFIAACVLVQYAVTSPQGTMAGGWTFDGPQLRIGFTRMIYPFFAGILLFRLGHFIHVKHAFWVCSLLVVIILAMPRIGGSEKLWMNGLYEAFCIILLFPLVVSMGASDFLKGKYTAKVCRFLGQISYPLYITHYPIMYIYTGWVSDNHLSLRETLPFALLVLFGSIAIAYASLKLYDEPVRNWLKNRFMAKSIKPDQSKA